MNSKVGYTGMWQQESVAEWLAYGPRDLGDTVQTPPLGIFSHRRVAADYTHVVLKTTYQPGILCYRVGQHRDLYEVKVLCREFCFPL